MGAAARLHALEQDAQVKTKRAATGIYQKAMTDSEWQADSRLSVSHVDEAHGYHEHIDEQGQYVRYAQLYAAYLKKD
ncbi:hypothetical protein DD237_005979 [Peronospora effusa]|uniref:Uncharacterized protein n=1 Tax=Peronospora effusa TaxID=542832 RepID=A0A425BX08_9STRA|nr:hypothetical protein DD237_005979 [Peronospora effusa]